MRGAFNAANSPRGKIWTWFTSGLPRNNAAHSGLITQVISLAGCASRIAATAGKVWTMSPSELGLMIRIDFGFGFRRSRIMKPVAMADQSVISDFVFPRQKDRKIDLPLPQRT